jgi:hypothetical protein
MPNRKIGRTTKRSAEKMEPGEMVKQRWEREGQEIIHQMPGRGGERREPGGCRWKHETGGTPEEGGVRIETKA